MTNNKQIKTEQTDTDIKRRIIQTHLQKLLKTEPTLYYASTSEIARNLHMTIKEHMNRMPVEEQRLFKNLTIEDVEMMLSFH